MLPQAIDPWQATQLIRSKRRFDTGRIGAYPLERDHMKSGAAKDLQTISDPEQVRLLSNDPNLDRDFDQPVPSGERARVAAMLKLFSVGGHFLPTMRPRTDAARAAAQEQLWARLNDIAEEIKSGRVELGPLAEWVRGTGAEDAIGPLVQQYVGRLFVQDFTATQESWAAACIMLEASRSTNALKMAWWRITGKVERARALLSELVKGDFSGVNGIGVALHHIVDGLHEMRKLAAESGLKRWTTDDALEACLFPPGGVFRRAKRDSNSGGCPYHQGSLFVLALGAAAKGKANRDLVFLSGSWSRCPADTWVIALLEGVWNQATQESYTGSSSLSA